MKSAFIVLACAFLAATPGAALSISAALSPVTRVVELLKGLSAQTEKEGKIEEGLYEDYVCWGKSIINQKTASNAAADSRMSLRRTLRTWILAASNSRRSLRP